jgi:hypothetical protein
MRSVASGYRALVGIGVAIASAGALLHCDDETAGSSAPLPDAANVVIDSGASPIDANNTSPQQDAASEADADAADADAAPQLPPPKCTFDELHKFARRLPDGGTVVESWEQQSVAYIPDAPWRIINSLKGQGREYFRGVGAGQSPKIMSGDFPFDIGFARTSTTSSTPNSVVCWGSGGVAARELADQPLTLRTSTGKMLGQCPGGTPVAGEVTLCTEGNAGCNAPVQGTLAGATLNGGSFRISGDAVDPAVFGVNGLGLQLVLFGYTPTQPAPGETKPLTGLFATLPTATGPGAIYCMGDGSEVRWATVTGTFITLKNVTKLGDCGGTTGGGTGAGNETLYLCRF